MKTLILLLAVASSNLFASDVVKICSKQFGDTVVTNQISNMSLVGKNCFIKSYVTKQSIDMATINEFLKLEKEIGEDSYDVHHINELYIYQTRYTYRLEQRNISYADLQNLSNFSVDELTPYSSDELYSDAYGYWEYLDVLRHAEVVTKEKLISTLTYLFGDKVAEPYEDDMTEELQAKIDKRAALYDLAITDMASLIIGSNKTATVYPLLDNDNENVQDAEWVIVGDDYVVVLNKFYWL